MGKSDPEPSKPYQGPQFGLQQQLLSSGVMGAYLASNPALAGLLGSSPSLAKQSSSAGLLPSPTGTATSTTTSYNPNYGGTLTRASYEGMMASDSPGTYLRQNLNPHTGEWGYVESTGGGGVSTTTSSNMVNSLAPQGFTQAGQSINGQMSYDPYQFSTPSVNFSQRTPYQFTEPQAINVPDLFTPQYDIAKRAIDEQSKVQQEQLLADMNRRGLLTTGGTNRAMELQLQESGRKLADLASQYSIAQGQSQLQEEQMRRGLEMQRQQSQAEELFRQQGASDEQAKYLADLSFNIQSSQAAQNLAGYNANLSGRQQATAEEQLANLFRRQPLEDLFKLYGMQTGQIGATEGSSGVLPILGQLGGAAIGALI